MNYTVEDLLEIIAGIANRTDVPTFDIESSDRNLIFSLAKQTIRGVALTDRQYELTKIKLLHYKNQFDNNGFTNIEEQFDNLRLPLREIDRSKWIRIIDEDELGKPYIGVRFPFSKQMIKYIEFLETISNKRHYNKSKKIHYVEVNEQNIYEVVNKFKNANFDIDDTLKEIYENIQMMKDNREENVPGIFGLKLKNLHQKAIDYAISSMGEPTIDNLALYKDKQDILGIVHFDDSDLNESLNNLQPLTKRIIARTKRHIFINKTEFTLDNVAESMLELYRFPIMFIVPNGDSSLDYIHSVQSSFKNIIPNDSVSTLFRKDNDTDINKEFNNYIKENKINNSLAISTKIVYISNNKLPKPLIDSEWRPSVALTFESNRFSSQSNLDAYLNDLDLVIHYDIEASQWNKFEIDKI